MTVKELKELLAKTDENYEVLYEGPGDRYIQVEVAKRVLANNYAGTRCFVKTPSSADVELGYTLSRTVIVLT